MNVWWNIVSEKNIYGCDDTLKFVTLYTVTKNCFIRIYLLEDYFGKGLIYLKSPLKCRTKEKGDLFQRVQII